MDTGNAMIGSKTRRHVPRTQGKEIRYLTFRCVAQSDANGNWKQVSVHGEVKTVEERLCVEKSTWLLPASQML